MSKIEKPKYFLKNTLKVEILDHYALNHKKNNDNFVTIIFLQKHIKDFLLAYIKEKC